MKSISTDIYSIKNSSNYFCIYVEESIAELSSVKQVIEKYTPSTIIKIKHYKDIFCRPRQNYAAQHTSKNIILAKKTGKLIYRGAKVCQDFGCGRNNFFYTSCVANCIMDCEYCFLKGMYDCGFLCIFVNLDDYFKKLDSMLTLQSVYLSISYDTDLVALESKLGYIKKWCNYAATTEKYEKLFVLEVRTKYKWLQLWEYEIPKNVIFAFSLSPQCIIDKYEHKTSSLSARLENIKAAQKAGANVRLCFDPIIYCSNWKDEYSNFVKKINDEIDLSAVNDISVGSFRISKDYFNKLRKAYPERAISNYPFALKNGYYQYNDKLREDMESYLINLLAKIFDTNKIFKWNDD